MKFAAYFLPLMAVLFLALNFINFNIVEDDSGPLKTDKFDSSLIKLNTLNKLESYIDSITTAKKIVPGSLDYVIEAKNVISFRFYHKYATQNLNENWIASVSQKITGLYLSSKITADDILTRPYGYCGQQSAVLMEFLEKKKFKCRAVYFPRHFALQVFVDEKWNYFDPNQEPDIPKSKRADISWLQNIDSLSVAYHKDTQWVKKNLGYPIRFKLGKINEMQGPHAQLFQATTKILSRIAFIFPLIGFVYLKKKAILANKDNK